MTIRAHDFEVLSCDWNKYEDFTLVTGSVDKTMRVWDIRQPGVPIRVMPGHSYAVRKVICSPHAGNLVASCSYDMTVCFWDIKAPGEPLLQRWAHHTEFAVGLDLSVLQEGMWASTGWDELVYVWNQNQDPRA